MLSQKMIDFPSLKVPEISVEEVKDALDQEANLIVLDVRTKGEYEKGNIQNSINVPVDEIEKDILSKIPTKDVKIFVYCLSGSRSVAAVEQMIKLGYKNVFGVKNGLLAWRAKGYPLKQ